ncbi:MAG: molecular chaperone DnaJ [Candidatus Acidiferrales bacterium]
MTQKSPPEFYEVLGVARNATAEQIKSAYRKAAMRWHPDRNPQNKAEAEEKFRLAAEAYSVLSDSQKRALYDQFGHAGVSGRGAAGPGFDASIFEEFRDVMGDFFGFQDIFGGGARQRGRGSRAQRGNDLRYDMTLTFEEAAAGVQTKIKLPRLENCEACNGTGAKPGTGMSTCQTCGGRGQLQYQQGFFAISRTCPSCQGQGQVIREVCVKCHGKGRFEREHTIEIRIPAGVDSQTRLRVASEGEPGANGGPPGDLYIFLEVKEHAFFERRGADLFCSVPISIVQAALGTEIHVPTLGGEEILKIPEGTQTGSIFRIKGKGLPNPQGGKGDLYVNVRVVTPSKVTREQRKLLEQLGQTLRVENKPAERGTSFFDKVKDIFG